MEMLILFIVMSIVNVIIQTVKSIATIKCGKTAAAIVNAVAYGLYTYVIVLTANDNIDLLAKCFIVAGCNFVGVYVVKLIEEKARKDKLWKVEATILAPLTEETAKYLKACDIPFSYIENVGKHTIFNIYCRTQAESANVKCMLEDYDAKYFVSESKTL